MIQKSVDAMLSGMKQWEHWCDYFFVPGRKTLLQVSILSHSWYRARAALDVARNFLPTRATSSGSRLIRTGYGSIAPCWPKDLLVIANEAGNIRVLKLSWGGRKHKALSTVIHTLDLNAKEV